LIPASPQGADFPMSLLQTALDACAALTLRVKHLEHNKKAQTLDIIKLKKRVMKLERVNKVKAFKLRRLKKVGTSQRVKTSDDTIIEDVSNQERMIGELDRDEGVELIGQKEKTKQVKDIVDDAQLKGKQAKKQAEIYQTDLDYPSKVLSMQEDDLEVQEAVEVPIVPAATPTVVPVTAAYARRRKEVIIRDPKEESTPIKPAETKSKDKGKGIMIEEPKPIKKKDKVELDKEFNINLEFLMRSKEQMKEEDQRAVKSINETPTQKAAKKRKLNEEAKEVKDLKQHLEIVPDEDDDVYTEATPLARKLYTSFITLLKNFDREDLETLWSIVKERFSTSKPNNFSDEYLLTTLKTMFGRPDGQDNVWKSQRSIHGQAMVKSWKLLTSCGVHILSFTTTQLILLVKRRYPLSKFTLEQMVNVVRLQVEEQSEMSLELLRFTRQQLQEGQQE
nr:hypothetical protein [Tanacetum cinerariifolium]GEZ02798.1 hypothetical protein [Tanacetum cinerariifolium]GEZ06516.1 hypothetical protein [Tanacetum cinerariifolium]